MNELEIINQELREVYDAVDYMVAEGRRSGLTPLINISLSGQIKYDMLYLWKEYSTTPNLSEFCNFFEIVCQAVEYYPKVAHIIVEDLLFLFDESTPAYMYYMTYFTTVLNRSIGDGYR